MLMKKRALSLLLAMVMLITFAIPASAQGLINITDYGEGADSGEPTEPYMPIDDNNNSPATPSNTEAPDEAELLAAMKAWLNNLQVSKVGGISLFSVVGDTGTVIHSTISIKPYALASSAVIKLSRSVSRSISSIVLPVFFASS